VSPEGLGGDTCLGKRADEVSADDLRRRGKCKSGGKNQELLGRFRRTENNISSPIRGAKKKQSGRAEELKERKRERPGNGFSTGNYSLPRKTGGERAHGNVKKKKSPAREKSLS